MKGKSASHHLSPLRYPGGKAKLAGAVKETVRRNGLLDSVYVEPFAGGAGVGLALLMHGYVNRIVINDLNPPIFAFWKSVLDDNERFCEAIHNADLSLEEWQRQRAIFRDERTSGFGLGFSAFYLNRTNHSGVLNGGVIGGKAQLSEFGIDARFNKAELIRRVKRLQRYTDTIIVCNEDAGSLLENLDRFGNLDDIFVYADPPYVHKGPDLYYDFFKRADHERLAEIICALPDTVAWAVSYDDHPLVQELYGSYKSARYSLSYSVKNGRQGTEVIFFSRGIADLGAFSGVPEPGFLEGRRAP